VVNGGSIIIYTENRESDGEKGKVTGEGGIDGNDGGERESDGREQNTTN
jgi:hypothetical protein